jgi:hypothetical protein
MAADAKAGSQAYVERMQRAALALVRKYWFDAGVIALAIGEALELTAGQDAPDFPDVPLAVAIDVQAVVFACEAGVARPGSE